MPRYRRGLLVAIRTQYGAHGEAHRWPEGRAPRQSRITCAHEEGATAYRCRDAQLGGRECWVVRVASGQSI